VAVSDDGEKRAADTERVSGTETKAPAVEADPDWTALITAALAARPPITITAQTFHLGPWASASRPVCVKCSDGEFRVLKGMQAGGRMLFNDQVIARLAQSLGAPVPIPEIVELTQAFIDANASVKHMPAGPCHASAYLDKHSDRQGLAHFSLDANRPRFASLAILYGWAFASDHQQIYPNDPPFIVWSVDHGHFVGPGNPNWTPDLLSTRPTAHADQLITAGTSMKNDELVAAAKPLDRLTSKDMADAVAAPPDAWNVPPVDRIAFAAYMWKRRGELLSAYAQALSAPQKVEAKGE
jgi:hypothetical protein